MKNKIIFLLFTLLFVSWSVNAATSKETFEIGKRTFLLNGEPFVVKAAELHYARIPEPYWEHRILMCKALGMNTICLYVFWNFHEQKEGEFDFPVTRMWQSFVNWHRNMVCISFCARDHTHVQSGKWADCLGGCSRKKI